MLVGIDTGGTNVDGVLVADDVVAATQVPGDRPKPVEKVLDELVDSAEDIERVVVVTTLVLNAALQERLPHCTNVIVPGPGLNPERAFHGEQNHVARGCIDTRGRVMEAVAYDEDPEEKVVAVTAKFGTRNPDPEERLGQAIGRTPERLAFGHASGPGLSFPERATTVANARARPPFAAFATGVSEALDATGVDAPAYYLKGDGEGYTVNVPVPPRTGDDAYLRIVEEIFEPLARQFDPDLLFVEAGQDDHFTDPLTSTPP